jgi:hypothetical protein
VVATFALSAAADQPQVLPLEKAIDQAEQAPMTCQATEAQVAPETPIEACYPSECPCPSGYICLAKCCI